MFWRISIIALAVSLMSVLCWSLQLRAEPTAPLGKHCIGVGPLDPAYCGCTWGAVYYRGEPVAAATVTLQFQTLISHTAVMVRSHQTETYAYYGISGEQLGARLGDVMTVSVLFLGETTSRTFRAFPDKAGDQHIPLVVPERGAWQTWLNGGYTDILMVDNGLLWAGGPAGLLAVELATQLSTTHTLPWPAPAVNQLALAPNGQLWAAGPHHLAHFDGVLWQDLAVPFATTIRALAVDPLTGAVWLGGGDGTGQLAVYTTEWQIIPLHTNEVRALAFDGDGHVWVSGWGRGVYRVASAAPYEHRQYRVGDGLPSDYINQIAVHGGKYWFAGGLAYSGARGHIGYYQPAADRWHIYSSLQGLPTSTVPTQLGQPLPVTAFSLAADGHPWLATNTGLHQLAEAGSWVRHTPLAGDMIRGLAHHGSFLYAGYAAGRLEQFDPQLAMGTPPVAQITASSAVVSTVAELYLASAANDEANDPQAPHGQILGWDWQSDLDGPLCTTAECKVKGHWLTPGIHTITLRVLDDEGLWSAPVATTVTVTERAEIYLPIVTR